MLLKNRKQKRRGAALVEYALLIAGVALVCVAAVAIFGHKTNDMVAATAGVLPGAHADDNNPIASGKIIETNLNGDGAIAIDMATIVANSNTERLGHRLGTANGTISTLVLEPVKP
jgi:Flp pilus assembly pilin Flp